MDHSITCGLYINIIIGDYLRTILNLNRNPDPSDWKLDPREVFGDIFDREGVPRGIGNQVSVEFNMIYRWHSATSDGDEAWTNDLFREIFGPKADFGESCHNLSKEEHYIMLTTGPLKTSYPSKSSGNASTNGPRKCPRNRISGHLAAWRELAMGASQMPSLSVFCKSRQRVSQVSFP